MTHGELQPQQWLTYTEKPHSADAVTFACRPNQNKCMLRTTPARMHTAHERFHSWFDPWHLIWLIVFGEMLYFFSSINRSESITKPTQVKGLHIIEAASAIPVLIRADCLKRSDRWYWGRSDPPSVPLSVQVSCEMDIFPLLTLCEMRSTSITGSWHHTET